MADRMPLPRSLDPNEGDDMIYFVAETAVRRLLNRIHSALYAPDNTTDAATLFEGQNSLNKLLNLSTELNRQLEEWYHSIPGKLRPPIGTEPITSSRGRILRIRYYAARHIIHRPFVLAVALQQMRVSASATSSSAEAGSSRGAASSASSAAGSLPIIPRVVAEKCENCIVSCTAYLVNVAEMLDQRSPYMWSFAQSCMACLLVLVMADGCPQLRPFTPEIKPLRAMVISRLKRWAVPGSSFEAEIEILERFTLLDRF
jgi:hypothetical protein